MSDEPDETGSEVRDTDPTPDDLKAGVREGILSALDRDIDRSGRAVARRLAAAGVLGVFTAILSLSLFSGVSLEWGHGVCLAVCAAAWAGLLVECFAIVLLRIEGGTLSLPHAVTLGLVGLGLAGGMALVCPHPHYLIWWQGTTLGAFAGNVAGDAGAAFSLGAVAALFIGVGASAVARWRTGRVPHSAVATALLFLLLWPAILLQSVGLPVAVFVAWTAGTALGSLVGIRLANAGSFDALARSADR